MAIAQPSPQESAIPDRQPKVAQLERTVGELKQQLTPQGVIQLIRRYERLNSPDWRNR